LSCVEEHPAISDSPITTDTTPTNLPRRKAIS
jgi:hypothetical protein